MYTELVIKESANRGYVEYYFNGQRLREYNANKLGLSILPNKAKTKPSRLKLLKKLKFELEKALEKGWNPTTPPAVVEAPLTLEESIQKIVHSKLTGNYSRTYTRDIEGTAKQFLHFLTLKEKTSPSDCTPKNGLNFHWKCAMAPVPVLDYIITHEMVHLKYPNHSSEFWNELDKKMPGYRDHENWLKLNGVKMSL